MSEEDTALQAAWLYGDDKTFSQISEELGISKSFAQTQVRRGIKLMEKEDNVTPEPVLNNPGVHQDRGHNPGLADLPEYPIEQNYRRPESYMLVTSGIPKSIVLTAKEIMIFDLWVGGGFAGDLSDFIADAINFMYESKRPAERFG